MKIATDRLTSVAITMHTRRESAERICRERHFCWTRRQMARAQGVVLDALAFSLGGAVFHPLPPGETLRGSGQKRPPPVLCADRPGALRNASRPGDRVSGK